MKITATCLLLGLAALSSAQTFTTSGVTGTGVSVTGISLSSSASSASSGAATFTLVGTTTLANPFSRFDVRVNSTRTIARYGLAIDDPISTTVQPAGTSTLVGVLGTTGGQSSTGSNRYAMTNGGTLNLSASVSPFNVLTTAQLALAAAQAPIVTQTSLGTSTATPGSPVWADSTATNFIFDFPSYPAGTATVNLSAVSGSFDRALNSLAFASQHKDTVTLVREFWLGGTLISTSTSSTSTFAPNAGAGAQTLNLAAGSVVLNASDIYATTKNFEVRTKLVGKAFLGNATSQLGSDYLIGQSSFNGTIQGVPEPASIAGLSLGLLAFARRRKSK